MALAYSPHCFQAWVKQGIREIDALTDPAGGEVWIGCPESLSGALLPPVIERLCQEQPRAIFHVAQVNTLSTQLEFPELRERKLDLILARLVRPLGEFEFEEDLEVEHLFDDELFVVAGMASPWARILSQLSTWEPSDSSPNRSSCG